MRKLFTLFLSTLAFSSMMAQSTLETQPIPRFEKHEVFEGGPTVYLVKETPQFELTKSEDGSEVYTTEGSVADFNFASIVVRFVPSMSDASPEDMEALLVNYLEFLQAQFGVVESAGVGLGHTKEETPEARGVIDYWKDGDGLQYAVKGWVNQSYLGVMLIYGPEDYPHFNVQQMYLEGFSFPK